MNYPTISFDESGNTGTDLLNEKQTYFVLASTDFTIDEANSLLRPFWSQNSSQEEVKFTSVVKSKKTIKKSSHL